MGSYIISRVSFLTWYLFLFLILPCLFLITKPCLGSGDVKKPETGQGKGQDEGGAGNTSIIVYFICHTYFMGLFSSFGKIY